MKKYNLSDIMKNAWSLFRAGEKSFSECLHEAWVQAKMMLIGHLWEKYGKRRIYFDTDAVISLCGIEMDFYKSGNICYCTRNGERVSNADGSRWAASADGFYYDLDRKAFFGRGGRYVSDVQSAVCAFLGC